MHPLNTNEEVKMKKISYFGKEYTIGDDVKWVSTCQSGNVITFIEEPERYCESWVAEDIGKRIDIWGAATYDWENSLRKVEDIIVNEEDTMPSSHPHADLMLKYAMIAQYDDKPWEHFEGQIGTAWYPMRDTPFYEGHNYRLKPQEPKIQVGQIWVSKEGVKVNIANLANGLVFTKIEVGGLTIPWSFKQGQFLSNFKLK